MCTHCDRCCSVLCGYVLMLVSTNPCYSYLVHWARIHLLNNINLFSFQSGVLRLYYVPHPHLAHNEERFVNLYESWLVRCDFHFVPDGLYHYCWYKIAHKYGVRVRNRCYERQHKLAREPANPCTI